MKPNSALRRSIVWVGPCTSGLGWLARQLQSAHHAIQFHDAPQELSADDLVHNQVDRIIVACRSRIDDPQTTLEALASNFPEIPRAVAMENWWDGSRRTGLGDVGHLALPWYRWWDGWVDWLAGDVTKLLEPVVCASEPWWVASPLCPRPTEGWVVANCQQMGEGWRQAASAIGGRASVMSAHRFLSLAAADHALAAEPAWVLWDDSCLDIRAEETTCIAHFLKSTAVRFPAAVRCIALSLPRRQVLESLVDLGPLEMLAKPNTGRGLQRLITTADAQWHSL